MWVTPRPRGVEIPAFYGSYYTHVVPTGAPTASRARKLVESIFPTPSSARKLRQRREEVLPRSLHVDGRSVLEIGCGNGVNLLALRRLGWTVEGHELDSTAAEVATKRLGRYVERGPVENVDWNGRRFDVVLTNHVLEHLEDPAGVVATCVSLLKPGGAMVNFTPNAHSLSRKTAGRRWRGFEPPRHLQVYGPKSVRRLLETAGLMVETIETSFASDGYLASRSVLPDGSPPGPRKTAMRLATSVVAQVLADIVGVAQRDVGGELLAVGRRPFET